MGSLKLCFGSQAESRYLPFIQTVLSPQRCVGLSYRFPAGLCICTSCVCCFSSLCVQSSGSALHTAHPRESQTRVVLGCRPVLGMCSPWSVESINNPRGWGFQCLPLYHVPGSWSLLGSLPILQPQASDFSCLAHLYRTHVWDHVGGG